MRCGLRGGTTDVGNIVSEVDLVPLEEHQAKALVSLGDKLTKMVPKNIFFGILVSFPGRPAAAIYRTKGGVI